MDVWIGGQATITLDLTGLSLLFIQFFRVKVVDHRMNKNNRICAFLHPIHAIINHDKLNVFSWKK